METWFPVPVDQMSDPRFLALTPVEKMYYWLIASEFNMRGVFYKADIEIAASLGLKSAEKIRKARRMFEKNQWINTRCGYRGSNGRNFATEYRDVKWSSAQGVGQFAKMSRNIFNFLLAYIRKGVLTHRDVCVYVYLTYWRCVRCGKKNPFFITKRELAELTNIPSSVIAVKNIYRQICSVDRTPMFLMQETHHALEFQDWDVALTPDYYMQNQKLQLNILTNAMELAEQMRADQAAKAWRKIEDRFYNLYKNLYGNEPPGYTDAQLNQFGKLVKLNGASKIIKMMEDYFGVAEQGPCIDGFTQYVLGNMTKRR